MSGETEGVLECTVRLVELSPGMWVDPDEVFAIQRAVDNQGAYKLGYSVVMTRRGLQMVVPRTPDQVGAIVNGTLAHDDLPAPAPEPPREGIDRPVFKTIPGGDQRLDGGGD